MVASEYPSHLLGASQFHSPNQPSYGRLGTPITPLLIASMQVPFEYQIPISQRGAGSERRLRKHVERQLPADVLEFALATDVWDDHSKIHAKGAGWEFAVQTQ